MKPDGTPNPNPGKTHKIWEQIQVTGRLHKLYLSFIKFARFGLGKMNTTHFKIQ